MYHQCREAWACFLLEDGLNGCSRKAINANTTENPDKSNRYTWTTRGHRSVFRISRRISATRVRGRSEGSV